MAELVTKIGKQTGLTSVEQVVTFYKSKLGSDPRWAVRGLIRIYQNQTIAEQNEKCTVVDNGIGFTGNDANFLSSLAQQFQRKGYLSPKQMSVLHKMMPKYAHQLFNCSVAEGKVHKVGNEYVF